MTYAVQVFAHKGPVPRSWAAGTISDVVHKVPRFSDSTKSKSIGPGWDVLSCGCRLQLSYPAIITNPLKTLGSRRDNYSIGEVTSGGGES